MAHSKDKKPNIDSAVKGLSSGYNIDVYSKLDRLLFDKKSEFYARIEDKYIRLALTKFLEDNNFRSIDSQGEFIFISVAEGFYRFTDEEPAHNFYDLPIEWDTLMTQINDYLKDNPLDSDEDEDIQETLTGDQIAEIQKEFELEVETRIYLIDEDDNRYYKGYGEYKGLEIFVSAYENKIEFDCDDIDEDQKETLLSRINEENIGDIFDKPMGRENRVKLKIYNSEKDGLLKTALEKELESLKPEIEEKGFAIMENGSVAIGDKEKYEKHLREKKAENEKNSVEFSLIPSEDSEYRTESLEEFKEMNGYEMGDEFLFSVGSLDPFGMGNPISITPKSYWDKNGFAYDQHIGEVINIPNGIDEVSESCFVTEGISIEDAISALLDYGFEFQDDYQDFMNQNQQVTLQNGMTVRQYVDTL